MRVRLAFGLRFGLLVERKELGEEVHLERRRFGEDFGVLIKLREIEEAIRLLIRLRERKCFGDITFKIFFYST